MAKHPTISGRLPIRTRRQINTKRPSILSIRTPSVAGPPPQVPTSNGTPTAQAKAVGKWLKHICNARKWHRKRTDQYLRLLRSLDDDKGIIDKFLKSPESSRPIVRWLRTMRTERKYVKDSMEKEERFLAAVEKDLQGILNVRGRKGCSTEMEKDDESTIESFEHVAT